MNTTGRQTGSMGDELTNAALIGLIALFVLTVMLRATGSVAAFLTGAPQPTASWAAGAGVLFNPGDPAEALAAPWSQPGQLLGHNHRDPGWTGRPRGLGMGHVAAPRSRR